VEAISSSFHQTAQHWSPSFLYAQINNISTNKLTFVKLVHKIAIYVFNNKFVYHVILTSLFKEMSANHVEVNWMGVSLVVVAKCVLLVIRINSGKQMLKMANVNVRTRSIMITDHVRHVKSF